jgi:hypothetical protein
LLVAIRDRLRAQPPFSSPLRLTRSAPPTYLRAMIICTAGGMTAAMVRRVMAMS